MLSCIPVSSYAALAFFYYYFFLGMEYDPRHHTEGWPKECLQTPIWKLSTLVTAFGALCDLARLTLTTFSVELCTYIFTEKIK